MKSIYKRLNIINKLYPWYSGLSTDLVFYIAINTIWLTSIKGFSISQITLLSTISSLILILFELPLLIIVKKIGNTISIKIGSFFFLLSSILLTFCNNYIWFVVATIFFEISLVFEMISSVLLKNNLDYLNKSNKYISIKSKASFIYSLFSSFITLISGFLFNIHAYLPMILGIIICLICFINSLFIFDIQDTNKKNLEIKKFIIPKPLNFFFLILIFYGLSFSLVVISQQTGKLLIQNELSNFFTIDAVAIYLSIILFTSRTIRIFINYLFPKIYICLKNSISLLFVFSLLFSFISLLIGFYLDINLYLKIIIMTVGFTVLPSLREPIKIYSQNFMLENFDKKYYMDTFIYLSLSKNIGNFIFGLFSSYFLLNNPLQYLFIIFIILIIPLIYIVFKIKNT